VQRGPQGLFAYVVGPDNKVKMAELKVAQESANLSLIESGLKEGDTVVIAGQSRLAEGSTVDAKAAPEASTAPVAASPPARPAAAEASPAQQPPQPAAASPTPEPSQPATASPAPAPSAASTTAATGAKAP
jgi:hypothetical protein